MIRHYLRVAFRQLLRHATYTGINILGLAVALACTLVVYAFVTHEYSYDQFHENADRVVRIIEKQEYPTGDLHVAVTPYPLGPRLTEEFHEVESTTRLFFGQDLILSRHGEPIFQSPIYVDSSFLRIFSYELTEGNPSTALARTHSTVLSHEVAEKLFGKSDPIGQTVRVDGKYDLAITGVLAPMPKNTHLDFDMLVSMPTIAETWPADQRQEWGRNAFLTYALLRPGIDHSGLASRLENLLERIRGEENVTLLYMQPLTDIHLGQTLVAEMGRVADPQRLWTFVIAAILVLIVAGLNFVNLATAHALLRVKELGVRSCLGAGLAQLRRQIIGETMVTVGIAAVLAVVIVEAAFSLVQPVLGTTLAREQLITAGSLPILGAVWLMTSLMIGFYLALIIARPRPSRMLREQPLKKSRLRAALVVVQFAASVAMVIMACVILLQQRHAKQTNLGSQGDQVLIVPLRGEEARSRIATLKQEVGALPGVQSVSAISALPNRIEGSSTFSPEGRPPEEAFLLNENQVDEHFFATFDLKVLQGRIFRQDESLACVVNETAVRRIGWDNAIGKQFDLGPAGKATVVGVVEDFYFSSVRDEMAPLILYQRPERYGSLAVRLDESRIEELARAIEAKFATVCPDTPYGAVFFDQTFDRLYTEELRTQRTLTLFAALAVLLACLGLYGLTAFSIQRRTKEVGIRKVFGASVRDIVTLQTREYFLWVGMANLAGWSIGYYLSEQWLQQYAYRAAIPWWLFVIIAAASLLLVGGTVSVQTIRAALANPVQALRHE